MTRGETGLPPGGTFLCSPGESSDPGKVNTEMSELSDQGETPGEPGLDLRDIREEILSWHSLLMLVKSADMFGERKGCLCKSGKEGVGISAFSSLWASGPTYPSYSPEIFSSSPPESNVVDLLAALMLKIIQMII